MTKLATQKRTQVVAVLVGGVSINSTCRLTGVAKQTVVWTWTAIDADSKLIVSYLLGIAGPKQH